VLSLFDDLIPGGVCFLVEGVGELRDEVRFQIIGEYPASFDDDSVYVGVDLVPERLRELLENFLFVELVLLVFPYIL
jgi:hypothetical protein